MAGSRPILAQRASIAATRWRVSSSWASKVLAKLMLFQTSAWRGGVTQHDGPHRGDHDGRARRLDGARAQRRRIDLVEAALERRLLLRQQPVDDLDIFAEAGDAFLRAPIVDAHHPIRRIDLQPDAEPDIEPATGNVVGGERLQGQQGGIAQRDLRDQRRQPNARRRLGNGGKLRPQLEPRPLPPAQSTRWSARPIGIEAELLDLPAAAQQLGPRHVRQHEHGEAELVGHVVLPHLASMERCSRGRDRGSVLMTR